MRRLRRLCPWCAGIALAVTFTAAAASASRAATAAQAAATAAEEGPAASRAADDADELEPGRWYRSADLTLNLTQSAFSDNWHGGENGALAWSAVINATADRAFTDGVVWNHVLKLRFGQQYQQVRHADGTRGWKKPEKSEDKIDYETIARLRKGWKVDPYVSGRWESRFLDVSDDAGRTLLVNPMTFRESAGVARTVYEQGDESALVRLGATARQNVRRAFVDAVGTATQTRTTHDAGVELQFDAHLRVLGERVVWLSKATVYKPLAWSKTDVFDALGASALAAAGLDPDVRDFALSTDVDWQNDFSTRVTEWLAFNVYVEIAYDRYDNSVVPRLDDTGTALKNAADVRGAVRKAVQWKQTFAVGLTFRLL